MTGTKFMRAEVNFTNRLFREFLDVTNCYLHPNTVLLHYDG